MTSNGPAEQGSSLEPIADKQTMVEVLDAIRARAAAHQHEELHIDERGPVASVLIPIYQRDGQLHVVLTKRSNEVETQRGDISFPGGMVEAKDADLAATALREAMEEIGLDPEHVEVLGRVDDFSTRNGEVHIAGFIGLIKPDDAPYPWQPSTAEVAEILEIPIAHLFDAANITSGPDRELNGRMWPNENFHFNGHTVFGATARGLRNFLDIVFPDGLPEGLNIKVDVEVIEDK